MMSNQIVNPKLSVFQHGSKTAFFSSLKALFLNFSYAQQVQQIWKQPFNKETNLNNQILELIRYATLAPSGHNTQPWKFAIAKNEVRIFPDYLRRLPVVDPQNRELFISLGCALENLVIAAQYAGYATETIYFPTQEPECILVKLSKTSASSDDLHFKVIPFRQCTRSEYDRQSVPHEELRKLDSVQQEQGTTALLFTEPRQIESFIEYVKAGDQSQFSNQAFVEELVEWIRFNDAEALKTRDGLLSRCSGNPTVPRWLGKRFMQRISGSTQGNTDEKRIRSSAGMIAFASAQDDKKAWIETGRVYERFALTATALNIKSAFLNQPVEVPELRAQLQRYLNLPAYPQLLVRFGYAAEMPRSLRRSVEQVLI